MPRRDGTGPMSAGAMTGRGLGTCAGVNSGDLGVIAEIGLSCRCGFGCGLGRRFRRGYAINHANVKTQKSLPQK
ncbi:MAG: DUF5320 domain-containing protein [Oscillospiraceae bacterium]|nr:DUF5320 domain-containing protein [Oscillospiraceae bacterium]